MSKSTEQHDAKGHAARAREIAIDRLATITGESTPERRRNHAEWILDAVLDVIHSESDGASR